MAGLVNKTNTVPENQRFYQNAYRAHTRIWKIRPGLASMALTPFYVVMWGTLAANLYMAGRKVVGYNTWFGKD